MRKFLHATYKTARRITIAIVGMSVLIIGVVMIALPGPAFIVIPAGLGILALEFVWAQRWLKKLKEKTEQAVNAVRNRNAARNRNGSKTVSVNKDKSADDSTGG